MANILLMDCPFCYLIYKALPINLSSLGYVCLSALAVMYFLGTIKFCENLFIYLFKTKAPMGLNDIVNNSQTCLFIKQV